MKKVFVVYCHPSENSFTKDVRDIFIKGIEDSGNEYCISDLYKMKFQTDMSENEYLRDSNYMNTNDIADDITAEHKKINSSDAIVFIYPVFWTEAPAKLVGWFDRVWTYGFAYSKNTDGQRSMKVMEKALFICSAGHSEKEMEQYGLLDAMKKVMIGDRLFNRAKKNEFLVLGETAKKTETREIYRTAYLNTVYEKALRFFEGSQEVNTVEGKYFKAVQNSETGEASEQTIFSYHQKNDTIWAEYSGGMIKKGFLVGTSDLNGNLYFKYQHINTNNEIKRGECASTLEKHLNGIIAYNEKWKWDTGESGFSRIEEI